MSLYSYHKKGSKTFLNDHLAVSTTIIIEFNFQVNFLPFCSIFSLNTSLHMCIYTTLLNWPLFQGSVDDHSRKVLIFWQFIPSSQCKLFHMPIAVCIKWQHFKITSLIVVHGSLDTVGLVQCTYRATKWTFL